MATKSGGEIAVNTTTHDAQWEQQVVNLSGGGFVVTWWDYSGVGSDLSSGLNGAAIRAQLYTAAGTALGTEISIPAPSSGYDYQPHLTALSNGGFVVTFWSSEASGTIHAQVFNAAGIAQGALSTVNTTTGLHVFQEPQTTALANGSFAVTWWSSEENGGDIRARVFDATGHASSVDFRVNTTVAGDQSLPQIAALDAGHFAITWRSADDIRARIFNTDGSPTGTEINVNVGTAGQQTNPTITHLNGGGFVVAWEDGGPYVAGSLGNGGATGDNDGSAVKLRVFADNGTPVSGELLANTAILGAQLAPHVTALKGGGFVVVWQDGSLLAMGSLGHGGASGDASGTAIKAQVYSATGQKVGQEVLVNTATSDNQTDPRVSALDNGGFAVTWTDASLGVGGATGDNNCEAVKAQVFAADGAKIGSEILVNTKIDFYQIQPEIASLGGNDFVITWLDTSNQVDFDVRAQVFSDTPVQRNTYTVQKSIDLTTAPVHTNDLVFATQSGASVTLLASQLDASTTITGDSAADQIVVKMDSSSSSGAAWTFRNWTEGIDTLSVTGTSVNDVYVGSSHSETFNGSGGLDKFVINSSFLDITFSVPGSRAIDGVTISGSQGSDTLVAVERVAFTDGTVAYDVDGDAGQAYRLYQAAFDRKPDRPGLTFWVQQLDSGRTSLLAMAQAFIDSAEFKAAFGDSHTLSDTSFLDVLYKNILGRSSDASGTTFWLSELSKGLPRPNLLASFSESAENKELVGQSIDYGIVLNPI